MFFFICIYITFTSQHTKSNSAKRTQVYYKHDPLPSLFRLPNLVRANFHCMCDLADGHDWLVSQ